MSKKADKKKKGINNKMFTTLVGFTLAIVFFVWISAFLVFNSIYGTFATREVEKVGRSFAEAYLNGDVTAAENILKKNGDASAYVFDSDGKTVYSFSQTTYIVDLEMNEERALKYKKVIDYEMENNVNYFRNTPCIISLEKNTAGKTSAIVYNEKHFSGGKTIYFYVSSHLVDSGVMNEILFVVCLLISLIALLMSIVFAIDLSEQITRPLVSLTVTANRFAAGDRNVVFNAKDFREVENLTDVLNYSNKELIKLDKFRQELLANVSHDIRTPLTIIKGNAELIRDLTGDEPEKRNKQLELIISETDRLNGMVEDILSLTRMQSGQLSFDYTSVDIVEVTNEIVNGFKTARGNEFEFVMSTEDPLYVSADKEKLKQVIYNLIGNAVNYSGDSRRIDLIFTEKAGDIVRFEVRDYGIGMSEDEINDIWLRYYRSQRMAKEVAGSGLGLNIVYNILSGMKASFGVNSRINEGSTFWFELKKSPDGY